MALSSDDPQPHGVSRRTLLAWSALGLPTLALTACTGGDGAAGSGTSSTTTQPTIRFQFAVPSYPGSFDPSLGLDVETFRLSRQIFNNLVGVDAETGAPTAELAESWRASEDGLTHRFILRKDVKFHSGMPVTADSIVKNFERWAAMEATESGARRTPFEVVFHHHATVPEDVVPRFRTSSATEEEGTRPSASFYAGARAVSEFEFELTLRRPLTMLIEALTHPGFGIIEPGTWDDEFPTGSGPYRIHSATEQEIVLNAASSYWGGTQTVDQATVKIFRQAHARFSALHRGDVHGYDLVTVEELKTIVQEGRQMLQRDPFAILYLGMNQLNSVLEDQQVRQAAAYAIDNNNVASEFFLRGTNEAKSFLPPSLAIPDPETVYGYDATKAAELLSTSTYRGQEIPFVYPTGTARAYLPQPERIYARIARQLTAAGFSIKPVPMEWNNDYIANIAAGKNPGFHLLGLSGVYRDPDYFLSTLFAQYSDEFGYDSPTVQTMIRDARSTPAGAERTALYGQILETLAVDLPAYPLLYPISALALNNDVVNYPVSPVLDEPFARVEVTPTSP
ncbi:peptide/nickel transport system substrate-binding protein [Neomicrococcus aestuarii]|uniref:Peptide/nickel transport system substrate-binding protein n=1 Tax=Neomicrococcus aestuarii TaxID=556325 RepID=A0A7W8WXJ0_9MICC|nr:ABC transporter substrate-binding protein [Neomicrococcus aestuarii]MBB5511326.1 peptide/nickel transport system substrate-binding protein [Neomicrococcus aestuarii]